MELRLLLIRLMFMERICSHIILIGQDLCILRELGCRMV